MLMEINRAEGAGDEGLDSVPFSRRESARRSERVTLVLKVAARRATGNGSPEATFRREKRSVSGG